MDRLQEQDEKLSKLRSLSKVVEGKISEAKDNDAIVEAWVDFMQLQLTELRRRTLLRTLLQLQSRLKSQRDRLDNLMQETVDDGSQLTNWIDGHAFRPRHYFFIHIKIYLHVCYVRCLLASLTLPALKTSFNVTLRCVGVSVGVSKPQSDCVFKNGCEK